MSLIYHEVEPENYREKYAQNNLIDFVLNYPQRKLINSSVRISADVRIVSALNPASVVVKTMNAYIDPQVGAHTFFDTITTSLMKFGQIENIVNYPRYVKVKAIAQLSPLDTFAADKVAALQCPNQTIAGQVIKGVAVRPDSLDEGATQNFSIKPDICLNSMASQGDNRLSFRKSGGIRLTVRLAQNADVFYGPDATGLTPDAIDTATPPGVRVGQVSYSLSNVRLHFETNPDDGKDSPIVIPNIVNIKTVVSSTYANLSLSVPATCRGFVGTFIKQSEEKNPTINSLACQNIPSLAKLSYLYNNATTNAQITYQITDIQEVLNRFTEALSSSYHNMIALQNQWHETAFGIGLQFDRLMDLSRDRFNIQLTSAISSTEPYSVNLFFLGVMTI
mgnify:FL=1